MMILLFCQFLSIDFTHYAYKMLFMQNVLLCAALSDNLIKHKMAQQSVPFSNRKKKTFLMSSVKNLRYHTDKQATYTLS